MKQREYKKRSSITEYARDQNKSANTIYKWIQLGKLETEVIGTRTYVVHWIRYVDEDEKAA